jgi:hypothetical protein
MWRLWNRLFGWHYASYQFAGGFTVGRIVQAPNGKTLVGLCCDGFVPIDNHPKQLTPLTMSDEEFELLKATK